MSRSATTTWTQQVNRRLSHTTGQSCGTQETLHGAIAQLAHRLRIDPATLLGALAARPHAGALWSELERQLRPEHSPRELNWSELCATADAVVDAGTREASISCWVAEPSDTAEVFALAACLARRVAPARLAIVATHSDPAIVEVGHSGLIADAAMRAAPSAVREEHFHRIGRCWQAGRDLRAAVHFEVASPFRHTRARRRGAAPTYHLVVSQGYLFRLDAHAAQRLAMRLHRALRVGGFLLVGPGDHDAPLFRDLDRCVAPGVLLYRKYRAGIVQPPAPERDSEFANLLVAIEADPTAWEPRWQLARLLLGEGHAEPAMAHLRELLRWRPDCASVWRLLAQAHTLLGDTAAANAAQRRADATAAPSDSFSADCKLLM